MACLYQRADSKYWWIEYIDAAGERRQETTKLRCDVTAQSRQARALCSELTTRELNRSGETAGAGAEMWAAWVPRFLKQRYGPVQPGNTRERMDAAWHNVAAFLAKHSISVPRQLTRNDARAFIEWRQTKHTELGVHKAAKNTALLEIKLLGMLMEEARIGGLCGANPCRELGIGRDEPEAKPPISVLEHRLITRALKHEPEWMRVSYKIAYWQGCRFSETCLPLSDVDLAKNTLRLRTKGKKKRVAEVPLSLKVRPLFRRLIFQERKRTFEMPQMPGKTWWLFFRKIGLEHLCFHCTRVSFITRCYEAGIEEADVMRLVLHASTTVHRIYPRLPASSPHLQEKMRRLAA